MDTINSYRFPNILYGTNHQVNNPGIIMGLLIGELYWFTETLPVTEKAIRCLNFVHFQNNPYQAHRMMTIVPQLPGRLYLFLWYRHNMRVMTCCLEENILWQCGLKIFQFVLLTDAQKQVAFYSCSTLLVRTWMCWVYLLKLRVLSTQTPWTRAAAATLTSFHLLVILLVIMTKINFPSHRWHTCAWSHLSSNG